MRRALVALATVLALVVAAAPPALAGDPVKDRKAAQDRANAAAARLAKATSTLARTERELADLEARAVQTQATVDALRAEVKSVAVNAYVRGNTDTFAFDADLSRMARGQAMARYVSLGNTEAIDLYKAAREDLDVAGAALDAQVAQRQSAAAKLRKEKAAAYRELERLQKIEAAHLARLEAQRRAAARATSARASRSASSSSRVTGVIASGAWICPVQGPRAFSNDYGQPRSGGRRHQGNDILSPRGTPVVASVGGSVKHHNSGLGGLSYYLAGDDGNTYFGTHLSSYGAGGRVAAGTVVGYVGDSGNARGTPHLHFEIHPGGGGPVNPYATLSRYC